MIYLNHAATTYPKPSIVTETVMKAISEVPASQYRGTIGNIDCVNWEKLCRGNLARLFQIKDPDRIFFTSGSTQAINMAILGSCRSNSDRHGIVITATEHNAVLRTIYDGLRNELSSGQLYVKEVPCDSSGYVDVEDMEKVITEDTLLVVVNHISNVTGALQNVEAIGEITRAKGALYLIDASQSAGVVEVNVDKLKPDFMAFTGHKSLYGIQGAGALYIRPGLEIRAVLFGGTGTDSEIMIPERPFYQVGTGNIPGIAGLYAGTEFLLNEGMENVIAREKELMKRLYEGLKEIEEVKVYAQIQPVGTAISFNLRGLAPSDVGYILSGSFGIQTRTGLHCAPHIHEYIGSGAKGTVRVSISYMTKENEIDEFLEAIKALAGNCPNT